MTDRFPELSESDLLKYETKVNTGGQKIKQLLNSIIAEYRNLVAVRRSINEGHRSPVLSFLYIYDMRFDPKLLLNICCQVSRSADGSQ